MAQRDRDSTVHNFTAAATDPDGDAISYSWNFGGITSSNHNQSVTYQNANTTTFQAVVTVTDSRGASSTGSVSVTSATLAGTFGGTMPSLNAPITISAITLSR